MAAEPYGHDASIRTAQTMSSEPLAPLQRVEVRGLTGRPELNGRHGGVLRHDTASQRFAVLLDDGPSEPVLVKRANLEPRDNGAASMPAAERLCERAVALAETPAEARRARRELATQCAARLHAWRLEAAAHGAAVERARSRSEVADDVWDRVVELQQSCQRARNRCQAIWPEILAEAVEADDAGCWSRSACRYARFLSAEGSAECAREGKRLAGRVLDVHACGRRCADACLAFAIASSETGGPVAADFADGATPSAAAEAECTQLAAEGWRATRERERMQRELQASWDEDTRARIQRREEEEAPGPGGGAV